MNSQLFKLQPVVISQLLFFLLIVVSNPVLSSIPSGVMASAKKGDADSQYTVARSYQLGKRVKSDINKALLWYNKAADQGHVEAHYRLGLIFYKGGSGYPIDFKKAFKHLSFAAKADHKRSQTHLAQMYENGDGVKRSETLSDYWYEQAFNDKLQSYEEFKKSQQKTTNKPVKAPVKVVVKPKPVKTISKPKNETVIKKEVISFPQTLLTYNWSQKGKASTLVQSPSSRCKLKKQKIVCTSEKIQAMHPTGPYRYKIKSILSQSGSERDMKIVYRKLYLAVPETSLGGYDDEDDTVNDANTLRLGWERVSHTINCRFESARAILCRPVGEDAFYLKVM